MLSLTVYRGDRIVQELDLDGPEIGIGRNADNKVVLPDDGRGVSRAHAALRIENGATVLYDRGSQNGTFVDGKRIKRAVVQPGQDIVIGPYRLVLMSVEAADADPDPGPTGTVLAARTTPPGAFTPPPAEATPAEVVPAHSQNTPATGSRVADATAGRSSAQTWMLRKQPSALYAVAGVSVVLLAAWLIWQLWPAPAPVIRVAEVTTTTTMPVTTTIPVPAPDPYAETLANAETAMTAAEQMFAAKRFGGAAAAFDSVVASLAEALKADPPVSQAFELSDRATERANEARKLAALAKVPPTVVKPVDPNAVAPRQEENERDYDLRNREAQQDYDLGRKRFTEGDFIAAIKIFDGLAAREPGWRDVSVHLKNSQDALEQARQTSLNDGLRRENSGYTALKERRFTDAASEFIAASKAFERAVTLQTPTAEKMANENLARRRQLADEALGIARTHANRRQFSEAIKLYQVVIDVLPPGDQLRLQAEPELKKIGPGG
jgi:tetratricopeptide (TPR) repeat protein